jgi:glutathione S-transferase
MDLYFAPLACSMATRIAFYEAGATANFIQVDQKAKRAADGTDFYTVNPMGQVPVLRTDEGDLLTENPAILQYVADRHPAAGLAPEGGIERYRLLQWMNFITSELHKVVFVPLLDPTAPEGAKTYARDKAGHRLTVLDEHLAGRDYLLDRFSIGDAYLITVLNWARVTRVVNAAQYPHIAAYIERCLARPAVARAIDEEMALYKEELARRHAA